MPSMSWIVGDTTRFIFKCNWCGKEEHKVFLEKIECLEAFNILPEGWTSRIEDFTHYTYCPNCINPLLKDTNDNH